MSESLLEMAKDLVSELIQSGQLPLGDMQKELQSTYASLMTLKSQEVTGASATATAGIVDWRKSITRNSVTCLECGQSFKQLSVRHLRQHNLDRRSYRVKYGIPRTQPLAARATTARRRELAQEIKPWEKAREMRAKVAKKVGRKRVTRTLG